MTGARRFCAIGALALAQAVALTPAWSQAASAPPARDQVERRVTSTAYLVEQSSAARQVDSSGNAEAQARRDRAKALLAEARSSLAGNDVMKAHQLVDLAARSMMEAVRMSAPEQVNAAKLRSDFDARLSSTRALIDAQQRIAKEKGAGARNPELVHKIEAMVADAQGHASAGRLVEAHRVLDQAYGAARASIGGMRGGDTLVRSLNFATKAEEYAYEVDRNDTHRMLVDVLLQDKRGGPADALIDRSLQAAAQLRRRAEQEAERRDFDAGVRSLEESTRELVRAIRSAGVFIPG